MSAWTSPQQAQPGAEAARALPHDRSVDPATTFNAAEYVKALEPQSPISRARSRWRSFEGGTMLYVDALCDGFSLTGVPPMPSFAELPDLTPRVSASGSWP